MNIQEDRIKYLLEQYASHSASESEVNELFEIIKESENDDFLKGWLTETIEVVQPSAEYDMERWDKVVMKVLSQESVVGSQEGGSPPLRFAPARNDKRVVVMWKRWTIAASVVGLLLVAGYWFFEKKMTDHSQQSVVKTTHDVQAPTIARATLKLVDGTIVYLDSVGNGQLAMQGNVRVVKSADGKIEYSQESGAGSQEIKYNTVSNPRGSKVQALTLIDGTQVWLNAASSITYPTAFVGDERRVTITGEAYFEVNPHPLKGSEKVPFFVEANGTTTQVLGTHFNVNAYSDEDAVRVTLLEGSVRLTQNAQSKMLEPGEQGIANPSVPSSGSGLRVIKDVNVEQVMAWKDGLFSFKKTEIGTMMRQIARWYDVDVSYEGNVANETITGDISRYANISEVLKMLQYAGLHFSIDGKKVVVKP